MVVAWSLSCLYLPLALLHSEANTYARMVGSEGDLVSNENVILNSKFQLINLGMLYLILKALCNAEVILKVTDFLGENL